MSSLMDELENSTRKINILVNLGSDAARMAS
jgi:hypothetical protein